MSQLRATNSLLFYLGKRVKALLVIILLLVWLPVNLFASQQMADEIAQISALPLSYLDQVALQKAIDTFLQTHPKIEGLRIIESLTGEVYVTRYRDGDRIVSGKKLPASVENFELYKANSMFNADQVGEVFLYVDIRSKSKLILSDQEKDFIAEHPILRVHNEKDWPPFNFYEGNQPKGYSIDFMNLLADKTGLSVHYVSGPSWNDFLGMIAQKDLDVMLNIVKSPERLKYLLFTAPFVNNPAMLITRKGFPVQNIEDLKGRSIAVVEGFFVHRYLEKNYPDIRLLIFKDQGGVLAAVADERADATIAGLAIFRYLSQRLLLTNLVAANKVNDPAFSNKMRIAVRNDWPILRDILQKAMDAITHEERFTIQEKWFGTASGKNVIIFSPAEEKWLSENLKPLKVANEMDWPPFDFAVDGEATGLSIDMIRIMAKKAGLKLKFINGYTWAELVEKFKSGEIDVLPAVYWTPQRDKTMAFTSPYATNPSVLVVRKDRTQVQNLSDLEGMKVAIVSGFATADVMKQRYPDIEQLPVKNVEEGLKAVSLKSADAFIGSLGVITHIMDTRVIPDIQIVGEVWLKKKEETELHMGVRKEDVILRDILQKGYDALTTEELRELRHRWLPFAAASKGKFEAVVLTAEERRWLSEHKSYRLGDDFSWPPFTFLDENNRFAGIAAGYAEAVSERLGIDFEPVKGLTWKEVLEKIKKGEIDILPAVARTEEREKFLNFTKPYISFPVVIATKKDGIFVDNLNDLVDQKVGVVDGYVTQEILAGAFPDLVLVPHKNLSSGLEALDKGEITAFVDNLGSITYEIERHKFENIKIAAPTQYRFDLSFGVRKDWPLMAQIMDKALETIDERERAAIKNAWMAIEVKYGVDLKTIILWVTPFAVSALLIIVFVVTWNRRLGVEITERKKAQTALSDAFGVITSSINYASRIQRSVLPTVDLMSDLLDEYFILWKPRDVVGGDIYWGRKWGDGSLVLLADFTGHGVPGAFMTLISSGALDRALLDVPVGDAASLIQRMHQIVQQLLSQDQEVCDEDHCSDDGLELGVCYIQPQKDSLTFSGAGFPLFYTDGNGLKKIKGDRKGIGYRHIPKDTNWTNKVLDVEKGMCFYMSSDGIFDQIGGPKKRGFGKKRFMKLLDAIQPVPVAEQGEAIYQEIVAFQGEEKRRDDVSAIGFKL